MVDFNLTHKIRLHGTYVDPTKGMREVRHVDFRAAAWEKSEMFLFLWCLGSITIISLLVLSFIKVLAYLGPQSYCSPNEADTAVVTKLNDF